MHQQLVKDNIMEIPCEHKCVCMYMCVCIYIYIHIYIHIHIYTYVCVCVCVYVGRERERLIDFKEFDHAFVKAGNSEICQVAWQLRDPGNS